MEVAMEEKKKLKIKPRKYGGNSSVVSIRMPDKLIEKIDEVAELTNRARNDIVIKLIDFALENMQIDNGNNFDDDDEG